MLICGVRPRGAPAQEGVFVSSLLAEAGPALRKTALNPVHRGMAARMVDFGGWDMPVEYPKTGGVLAEHMAVRTGVGVFDVSHMGDIRFTGPQALDAVQHISMNDAARLVPGQAHYSAMLYPEGTFVDDIIVHKIADQHYLFVINAGTREKDADWVQANVGGFRVKAENVSDEFTQIAIQGPKAEALLLKLTDVNLSQIKNYWFTFGAVCGLKDTMIARTGYTGEDGFEIYVPSDPQISARVWHEVLEAGREFGAIPCGLGARNTLRLEARMALYGHEISESINVFEAGLDRWCKLEKPEFVGKAALEKVRADGVKRTLVGLEMIERGIARDGYPVLDEGGASIGYVTSGSLAPFLKKNIALAYLPPSQAEVGTVVNVEIRGQRAKAKVVPTPFYKRPRK
jgi:aminomethyltransferase